MALSEKTYRIEKDVKAAVRKLLEKHQWFGWMPAANAFGKSGASDFQCLRDGVFMVIETKFGSGKPSAMQDHFLEKVEAHGGLAWVVNEKNIDHFEAYLAAFDRAATAASQDKDVAPEDGSIMMNAAAVMHRLVFKPKMKVA